MNAFLRNTRSAMPLHMAAVLSNADLAGKQIMFDGSQLSTRAKTKNVHSILSSVTNPDRPTAARIFG